jgi:hypothetical protein
MATSPFFSVVQGFLNGTAEVSTVRGATTQREMCLLFTTFQAAFDFIVKLVSHGGVRRISPRYNSALFLSHQPYQWGILAGCLVYITGVVVVLYLLVAGGSFERMREQVRTRQGQKAGIVFSSVGNSARVTLWCPTKSLWPFLHHLSFCLLVILVGRGLQATGC